MQIVSCLPYVDIKPITTCHQPRPEGYDIGCRRDRRCRLQSVRGWDLRDGIRSESIDEESVFITICCPDFFFSFSLLFCEQHLSIRPDSPDLRLTIFAAGATVGISCSLCEAGTYWTGSGQDPLTEKTKEFAIDVLLIFLSYIC
jgi:hypothetical protein